MNIKTLDEVTTLGELVRAVRSARDLTQVDVSRLIGVSQSKVAKWERGTHEMRFVDAVAFADATHTPIELLVEVLKREKALTPKSESLTVRPKGFEPLTFWSGVSRVPDFVPSSWFAAIR